MRSERGVALVQVLVMSVMLLTLASAVMQMMFGTHVMVSRAKTSDQNKMWIESCLSQKNETWAGSPCGGGGSDSCDYAPTGPTVNISCSGGTVSFTVNWN